MKNLAYLLIFMSSMAVAQSSQAVQDFRNISGKYSVLLKQMVDKNSNNLKDQTFLKQVDSLSKAYENDLDVQLQKIKDYEDTAFVIPVAKENTCGRIPKSERAQETPNFDKYLKHYKYKKAKPFEEGSSTRVTFIVEATGDVSFVRTEGRNADFNREAEKMIYLQNKKWTPNCVNNVPTRTKFIQHLTMGSN